MPDTPYRANISQSQGRTGFSVIFRHPVALDSEGRPRRRIRRGLGTRDRDEADRMVQDLNAILADRAYWDVSARPTAAQRFDARVVDIFYSPVTPENVDFAAIRDEHIPLPSSTDSGYRRALLVGTTGAGKTTLARQLMGTGGRHERFPSTSTARTTIADTEIVIAGGPFHAVVTFFPLDEVRDHVEECVAAAVLAAQRGEPDSEVLSRLLTHANQRFRFSYVLGAGPLAAIDEEDDDDDEDFEADVDDVPELAPDEIDVPGTDQVLTEAVTAVRGLASSTAAELRETFQPADAEDERAIDELFEEELDSLVRGTEQFHRVVDELLDEIEKRFSAIQAGELQRSRQGWPLLWRFESDDRRSFLRQVLRFTSNYAPLFGHLLTPLVNGIRVAGPFQPAWTSTRPDLVLIDGEGLGHTTDSSASLSTALTRRFDDVDAILLVDTATQPMQHASIATLKSLIASGHVAKLLVCFTHFDQVRGDNLPNAAAKERHVRGSLDGVLTSFGEELGSFAERALRGALAERSFYVGGIDRALDSDKKSGKRTIAQLDRLMATLDGIVERPEPTESRPVYDQFNLAMAVRAATENFQRSWRARLGLTTSPTTAKEHWTRVKALSRRLAVMRQDEYSTLRPVADLREQLVEQIYVAVQSPVRWEGGEPSDDEKQAVFDRLAHVVSRRMTDLAARRVWGDRMQEWQRAYALHGAGSTFVRARLIADEVYDRAAPIPEPVPTPDRNRFLHEVVVALREAAEEAGVEMD